MLYKNDKRYELIKSDQEQLNRFIGKWPAVVNIVEERRTYNERNKSNDVLSALAVECVETVQVKDKNGIVKSEIWKYAEKELFYKDKQQFPNVNIKDGQIFDEKHIEFVFFLYKCCRHLKDGLNTERAKINIIEFSRPLIKMKQFISEDALISEVKNVIYKANQDEINLFAKSYWIQNIENLDLIEIQVRLMELVTKGNKVKEKCEEFLKSTGSKDKLLSRKIVQDAVDFGIVGFNPSKRTWNFMDDGVKQDEICKVPMGQQPNEYLYKFSHEKKDVFEILKSNVEKRVS